MFYRSENEQARLIIINPCILNLVYNPAPYSYPLEAPMSGESPHAHAVVLKTLEDAQERSDMDKDAMGRAIILAVVEQYLSYRTIKDVRQELEYLAESLDDDEPVVTRGC